MPNPCQNSAPCIEQYNAAFLCTCLPGTTGPKCETNLTACSSSCKFGECLGQLCQCVAGYTGPRCDIDISECGAKPCQNGGQCSEPFLNMYACTCPPGYTGQNCDLRPQICDSRPCLNGGQCQEVGSMFVCTCLPGTTGTSCEVCGFVICILAIIKLELR